MCGQYTATKQDVPILENQATSVKGVLQAALWMLENVGWTRGAAVRAGGRSGVAFCASGAIDWVQANWNLKQAAAEHLAKFLPKIYGGSIISFNDAKETTKKQVLTAFKLAIKNA